MIDDNQVAIMEQRERRENRRLAKQNQTGNAESDSNSSYDYFLNDDEVVGDIVRGVNGHLVGGPSMYDEDDEDTDVGNDNENDGDDENDSDDDEDDGQDEDNSDDNEDDADSDVQLDANGAIIGVNNGVIRRRELMSNGRRRGDPEIVDSGGATQDESTTEEDTTPFEPFVLPELKWDEWEEVDNKIVKRGSRLHMQRHMWEKLIDVHSFQSLDARLSKESRPLMELHSICSCPHGLRTVGACAHRIATLTLLSKLLRNERFDPSHQHTRRSGSLQINIDDLEPYTEPQPIERNVRAQPMAPTMMINIDNDDEKDLIMVDTD